MEPTARSFSPVVSVGTMDELIRRWQRGDAGMSGRYIVLSGSVRRIVLLVLAVGVAVALTIGFSAAAQANPSAGQYGNPAGTASGNPAASGNAPASSAPGSGGGGVGASVLPATGGPLIVLVALGGLALGSTGLLALRLDRRE